MRRKFDNSQAFLQTHHLSFEELQRLKPFCDLLLPGILEDSAGTNQLEDPKLG